MPEAGIASFTIADGPMDAAWIAGLQSSGTGAIAKPITCNDSETQRDRMNVQIDERALREIYLLPFELAAAANGAGFLTAYAKRPARR